MKRKIKFRSLLSDETHVWWEYYTTLTEPAWMDVRGWEVIEKDLQYTGLKDKNGKEIYEGDIIQFAFKKPDNLRKIVVESEKFTRREYYDEGWGLFLHSGINICLPFTKEFEVIGNIYENSELL
jgi:uncharacterized phage protein (TIGR01671 family)